MPAHDLIATLEGLPRTRVLVLGDLVLDRYTWGNIDRVSPEAAVMVLEADRRETRLGGAANVAHMLTALESAATCIGVIGNDSDGQLLCDLLLDAGVTPELVLTDPSRPTTTKERFIGRAGSQHPSQVLRVDSERRAPLATWLEDAIINHLGRDITQHDLLLISDYGKGVCTPRVLQAAITAARSAEIPVLIDPMRTTDWARYRGATLLKVNRAELQAVSQRTLASPGDVLDAGGQLCATHDLQSLVVTLGHDGTAVVQRDGSGLLIPTQPREVYDVTGAGDLLMAVLGVCLASGLTAGVAAQLAAVATHLKLERFGVALVTRRDLHRQLTRQRLIDAIEQLGTAAVMKLLPATTPPPSAIAGKVIIDNSEQARVKRRKQG